ncbi:MAG TPA: ribosome small subunit-dependent GTPase A [Gemmataceae bacterium]|nr:ribosome small subunit-dependent GTPase A [Gemmataceae bacterium]
MAKKKKVRVDMRKNRSKPPRQQGWTRGFQEHGFAEEATTPNERVRAKGDLSRRRTIVQEEAPGPAGAAPAEMPAVDSAAWQAGRVLRVHRLFSVVETEDGRQYRCAVRRLLRTLATDERNIVTTGDRVWFRLATSGAEAAAEGHDGFIERVEPRHGLLKRASRGREQVLVANVDQVVFVVSLLEPELKPHLIDRYLCSAAQGGIRPLLCLNKVDLADPATFQPLVGLYSQLGVPALLTSATSGAGIAALRERLRGRQTVFTGQSGVGKSSLLNAVEPGLGLRVREVSEVNQKGKHTTTGSELIRLGFGGWVVDTPGVRQFELWDTLPEEVEGYFAEFRPFVHRCAYPDCTHTHEDRCAVKRAALKRQISASRYTSYLGLFQGESAG